LLVCFIYNHFMNASSTQSAQSSRFSPGFVFFLIAASAVTLILVWVGVTRLQKHPNAPEVAAPVEPAAQTQAASVPVPVPVMPAAAPQIVYPPSVLSQRGGIQVERIALTMSGAVIDLRYKIVDRDKVGELVQSTPAAYLVDQASGTQLTVGGPPMQGLKNNRKSMAMSLKMTGQLDGFPPASEKKRVNGQSYSVLSPNQRGILKPGSKVTLVVGDLMAGDLVVE